MIGMPNSTGWRGGAGFKRLEENYFPALGFANRTDIDAYELEFGHTWWPSRSRIRAIYSGVTGEHIEGINADDRSQEIELKFTEIENQTADSLVLSEILAE